MSDLEQLRHQLHFNGFVELPSGRPDWELCQFVERLHRRYQPQIEAILEQWRSHWLEGDAWSSEDDEDTDNEFDDAGDAPGSHRPGGLAARHCRKMLRGSGLFIYATHPSQRWEETEAGCYSGPRWYVSCMEAVMQKYGRSEVVPPPPREAQELIWPCTQDRGRPWLTEVGWTVVPAKSDPQVIHADICSYEEPVPLPRQRGLGRFLHLAWKADPSQRCTTQFVPGGFTEGLASPEDYARVVKTSSPAVVFDSEVLHGGAATGDIGWGTTLTAQLCSEDGWPALQEHRVSDNLLKFTYPIGWEVGAAVDAKLNGTWHPATVHRRSLQGRRYVVRRDVDGSYVGGLSGCDLRHREAKEDASLNPSPFFRLGSAVEVLYEGDWTEARIKSCNADGTYRVVWAQDKSFTDAVPRTAIRVRAGSKDGEDSDSSLASTSTQSSSAGRGRAGKPRIAPRHREARPLFPQSTAHEESHVLVEADSETASGQAMQKPAAAKRAKVAATLVLPSIADMRSTLHERGWIEMREGMPESWRWALIGFVEAYHAQFNDIVIRELAMLRSVWEPFAGSSQRYGAFAAYKVTERLRPFGVAVYTPQPCQEEVPPYLCTGPRWYVSITKAAFKHFGTAPAPPPELCELLFSHPEDQKGDLRARGLGWTLAPPGSDPQMLHADIWGNASHPRTDRVRFPHVVWKADRNELCTTQVVPGAFTEGTVDDNDYHCLTQVRAPCFIFDSEMLHRGAATPSVGPSAKAPAGWVSSCSLELCTPSGWEAWSDSGTWGTEHDDGEDWRMLTIARPSCASEEHDKAQIRAPRPMSAPILPRPPWASGGIVVEETLRKEQQIWEFLQEVDSDSQASLAPEVYDEDLSCFAE